MMDDIPESLIAKARKIIHESEESLKNEKEQFKTQGDEQGKTTTPPRKGEPITFNPEIRPDVYTEPYKVQPTN